MKHLKYLERYQKMRTLIIHERTGTSEEFAEKIGISRRMLFNYLDDLRDMGLEMAYCRRRNTYYPVEDRLDGYLLK